MKNFIYNTYHFSVLPQVYNPADDTFLIATNLNIPKGATILARAYPSLFTRMQRFFSSYPSQVLRPPFR
jgi:hypothetical protein